MQDIIQIEAGANAAYNVKIVTSLSQVEDTESLSVESPPSLQQQVSVPGGPARAATLGPAAPKQVPACPVQVPGRQPRLVVATPPARRQEEGPEGGRIGGGGRETGDRGRGCREDADD